VVVGCGVVLTRAGVVVGRGVVVVVVVDVEDVGSDVVPNVVDPVGAPSAA
jgi:hypothetical protein